MQLLFNGGRVRKYAVRVKFVGLIGVRRRRRWLQPFIVAVHRIERAELGTRQ